MSSRRGSWNSRWSRTKRTPTGDCPGGRCTSRRQGDAGESARPRMACTNATPTTVPPNPPPQPTGAAAQVSRDVPSQPAPAAAELVVRLLDMAAMFRLELRHHKSGDLLVIDFGGAWSQFTDRFADGTGTTRGGPYRNEAEAVKA